MITPKLVFVDAGHGLSKTGIFKDVGATTFSKREQRQVTEREINIAIGKKILAILSQKLPQTTILGVSIEGDSIAWRKSVYMNKVMKDLKYKPSECFAISLHVNSNIDKKGTMGFYQNSRKEGIGLLHEILLSMRQYFALPILGELSTYEKKWYNHGKLIGRGLYIDSTQFMNVLVEMGYIGNPDTLDILLNQQDRVTESIAHGILEYFRNN